MKILIKSIEDNKLLMSIQNSREFQEKSANEIISQIEEGKITHFDEEGNPIGYQFGGYLLQQDFYIEVEE